MEYDPLANVDDNSCLTLIVEGCTDPTYLEYDPLANVDDNSCLTLIVEGCTDPIYLEYNPLANEDDGSCLTLIVVGCIDINSCNFNELANEEDDSCIYLEFNCDYCSGDVDGTGFVVDGDSDDDGLCDAEDTCPNDPLNDIDQDGVCGDEDNCPETFNPDQEDADEDGSGDACDISLSEEFVMDVSIYPNPAQSMITISYSSSSIDNLAFKLYNSIGQLLLDDQYINVKKLHFDLDVDNFERGLYSIELINSKNSTNHLILLN